MIKVIVTGAASGLGQAIVREMKSVGGFEICEYDAKTSLFDNVLVPNVFPKELDILINCAGVNGIDYIEDTKESMWDRIVNTNAKGIFMMTKACLSALKESKGTVLNITSNAAWTPMTASIAYNASKGAAHIMTLQMARELTKRHGITVFGVAPNKLEGTEMSEYIDSEVERVRGWSKDEAKQYQLNGLLTGKETPVERVAEFIVWLLQKKERHEFLTGCILPYGA